MPLQFNFASPNYASAVELALGPVLFMSVSMLLNSSIGVRLGHVMDRAKFLRGDSIRVLDDEHEHELSVLRQRARLLQRAMRASSLGALMFALVDGARGLFPDGPARHRHFARRARARERSRAQQSQALR